MKTKILLLLLMASLQGCGERCPRGGEHGWSNWEDTTNEGVRVMDSKRVRMQWRHCTNCGYSECEWH